MASHIKIPFIKAHFGDSQQLSAQFIASLESGWVTNNGPKLRQFEQELADYLDLEEVVVVNNGSDALWISLKSLNLPKGKVVLPAYTYIATLNAVVNAGFEPIFCDIEADSFTLSPKALESILASEDDVRCVIPVNAYGIPPDMKAIKTLCEAQDIKILYDNCHGFGTKEDGHSVNLHADIITHSFHATKVFPAVEGGLIISREPDILHQAKILRNHGLASNPEEHRIGTNAKMDELREAVGRHTLKSFPKALANRRSNGEQIEYFFRKYDDVFQLQKRNQNVVTNYQNMGVCAKDDQVLIDQVITYLMEVHGLQSRRYFYPPLNTIPGFQTMQGLSNTRSVSERLISFPIHSYMTPKILAHYEQAITDTAERIREGKFSEVLEQVT